MRDRLVRAIGQVDDELILEADAIGGKKPDRRAVRSGTWVRWVAVAACVALLAFGAFRIARIGKTVGKPTDPPARDQELENHTPVTAPEIAYEKPWEEKADFERYPSIRLGSSEYHIGTGTVIYRDMIGDAIGEVTATGYDAYTDQTMQKDFTAYRINGVSTDYAVAVWLPNGSAYAYRSRDYFPATLGQLFTDLNITDRMIFDSAYAYGNTLGRDERTYYTLSQWDVDRFLEVFYSCGDAPATWSGPGLNQLLSIAVFVPEVGVENLALGITSDGYVWTNLVMRGCSFYVGTERAEALYRIIVDTARQVGPLDPYSGDGEPETMAE